MNIQRRAPINERFQRTGAFGAALMLCCTLAARGGNPTKRPDFPEAYSIPVVDGHARVAVATPSADSKYLVIVAPLALDDKTYEIKLSTRPVSHSETLLKFRPPLPPRCELATRASGDANISPPSRGPSQRGFYVLVRDGDPASASNYREVGGRLRAVGRHIQVYVDEPSLARVSDEALRRLVHCFDDEIWPRAAARFGAARDVDGDGVLTVFLTEALRELGTSVGSLDGAMRGADFDTRIAAPLGNSCDLILLNGNVPSGAYLHSVLAHEYMHAVLFSRRLDQRGTGVPVVEEESWLDEAIAHLAEDSHSYTRDNIDHRVQQFLAAPERYRVVVDDYYGSKLFRSHGHRGAAYLFVRWCADTFGWGIMQRLVDSHARGTANLEQATGWSFQNLFRAWTLDVYFNALRKTASSEHFTGSSTTDIDARNPGISWSANGTAPRFFIVTAQAASGLEINVEAPNAAGLQFTVAPLPTDLPRLQLDANIVSHDSAVTSLQLKLRECDGHEAYIDATQVLIDRGRDVSNAKAGWRTLEPPEIRNRPNEITLGPRQTLTLTRSIEASLLEGRDRVRVRAVGRDVRGRRIAAWCDVDVN